MTPPDKTPEQVVDELQKLPLKHRILRVITDPVFRLFLWRGRAGFWGQCVMVLLVLTFAGQLVPGRAVAMFAWPGWVYYAVIGGIGLVTGFLSAQRRVLGSLCCALVGTGMLWGLSTALAELPSLLPESMAKVWALAGVVVGFIPGVVLYGIVNAVLPKLPKLPPGSEPATTGPTPS